MNLCLSVAGILHNETPHGASQSFMMDNSMGLSPAQLDPFYTQGYIYISIWIDGWKGGKKDVCGYILFFSRKLNLFLF